MARFQPPDLPADDFSLPDADFRQAFEVDPDLLFGGEDFALPPVDDLNLETDLGGGDDLALLDAAELDDLFAEAAELSGAEPLSPEQELVTALQDAGLAPQGQLELAEGDAPFYHDQAATAFWFGTLQPDPEHNPNHGVAGILAITPEGEGLNVDFAPYASGELEECQAMSQQLIDTAEQRGLAEAFDRASELSMQHQERPPIDRTPQQLDMDF